MIRLIYNLLTLLAAVTFLLAGSPQTFAADEEVESGTAVDYLPYNQNPPQNLDDLLKQIQIENGPTLKEADFPALYQNVRDMFSRLSKAQLELIGDRALSVNHIVLVESKKKAAKVYSLKPTGVRMIQNVVVVTVPELAYLFNFDLDKQRPVEGDQPRIQDPLGHLVAVSPNPYKNS